MKKASKHAPLAGLLLLVANAPALAGLTLSQAIDIAVQRDPQQTQLELQAEAARDMGVAQSQWMDPKVKLGLGALPLDTFTLTDDMMTNLSVGMMQSFPRGDSSQIKMTQGDIQAQGFGIAGEQRQLELTRTVTQLWIELHYLDQVEDYLKQRRSLMRRLQRDLEENYALGNSQAEDVVNAELNVAKLGEQLLRNQQQQQATRSRLSEWLGDQVDAMNVVQYPEWTHLTTALNTPAQWSSNWMTHPMVRKADQMIAMQDTQVALAEEAYKPEFGVEVMYAHRQADTMAGGKASDLASVFVTMDVPLFKEKRQDKRLNAAQLNVGAAKSQRDLVLQQFKAESERAAAEISVLEQRIDTYQSQLIKHANERKSTVERSYQNGLTPFAEVVKASNDVLTLEMELARIKADCQQQKNQMAFFLNRYF